MSKIKKSHTQGKSIKVTCSIVVVSDSLSKIGEKWKDDDKSGKKAKLILEQNLIAVQKIEVISDNSEEISKKIISILESEDINFVLTIGGTGIAKRDVTIESLSPIFDKELPGFGELFRSETFKHLKTVSIMSRATAGVKNNSLICCLPGSPNAVELGLNLIIPEIDHILKLLLK